MGVLERRLAAEGIVAESDPDVIDRLRREITRLGTDLQAIVRLRWRLAQLECRDAVGEVRRLAIVLVPAGVATIVSLSLGAVAGADLLEGYLGFSRAGWLAVCGAGLLAAAVAAAWLAWRRFRRQFTGLRESLEELHEDAVWFREWIERGE
jgi:hypothetical protein